MALKWNWTARAGRSSAGQWNALTWDLLRSDSRAPTQIAPEAYDQEGLTVKVRHTVTGLTNGTAYTFNVRARKAAGTSGESNAASATPASTLAPGKPTLTAESNVPGGVTLTGRMDSSYEVTGWQVQRDGGSWEAVNEPQNPPHLLVIFLRGLTWDTAYSVAADRDALAPYQPSQRYFLLNQRRMTDADLPAGNLLSAFIGLGKARSEAQLRDAVKTLIDLLEGQPDNELTRVFNTWIIEVVRRPDRLPDKDLAPLEQLKETYTMLEETVQGWVEEGLEQGRSEERALLCRLAARKFDDDTAGRLAAALAGVTDPDRLAEVGEWIIECATAADLIARVVGDGPPHD